MKICINVGLLCLVRDPYQAVISWWRFQRTWMMSNSNQQQRCCLLLYINVEHCTDLGLLCRPSSAMDQDEFDTFVTRGLTLWLEIITDWVTHAEDLHIIFYEVI